MVQIGGRNNEPQFCNAYISYDYVKKSDDDSIFINVPRLKSAGAQNLLPIRLNPQLRPCSVRWLEQIDRTDRAKTDNEYMNNLN